MHLQTEFIVRVSTLSDPENNVSLSLGFKEPSNREKFISSVMFLLDVESLDEIRVEWLTPIPKWLQDYNDVGDYVFNWIKLNRWERREMLAYVAIFGEEHLAELDGWPALMTDIKERGEGRFNSSADFTRHLIESQQTFMFMQEWEEFIDYDKYFEDKLSGSYEGFDSYYFYIN